MPRTSSNEGSSLVSNRFVATTDSSSLPRSLPFYLPYVVPLATIVSHYSTAEWHTLIAPFFVWVVVPLLDFFIGGACPTFSHRLTIAQRKDLESKASFKLAVLFWCPTQFAMLIWAAYRVQQVDNPVVGTRLVGLVWSISLIAAEGINCSHELLHRRSRVERFLGKALLISVLYGHFNIEHARGHHFRVATPEDPATLRYGESFYHFFPRTVIGGYKSAWSLELARLRRYGYSFFSYHNELIISGTLQVGLCFLFYGVLGVRALFLFLFQAACAILLLEQINAIEHYGLLRKQAATGEYERVGPRHSWDSPHTISSYLLFKLQLHADHHLSTFMFHAPSSTTSVSYNVREQTNPLPNLTHVDSSKRYQVLELTEGSPTLPAGYLSLAPLLLVPPLWRYVMDSALHKYWKVWKQQDEARGYAGTTRALPSCQQPLTNKQKLDVPSL